ncbi:MAG: hypothetical protein AAGF12_25770 [Myxococcota bacterium]
MTKRVLFGLTMVMALGATPTANAQEILDREFLVGPRVGIATIGWDLGAENGSRPAPLVTVGIDLRKELGTWVLRGSSDLQIGVDLEAGGLSLDLGANVYLTDSSAAPYLGAVLGLRAGSGPYDYNAIALGFGGNGQLGMMFNRTSSIRFFVEASVGAHFMSYQPDSLGTPTPPGYLRSEFAVAGGVLF